MLSTPGGSAKAPPSRMPDSSSTSAFRGGRTSARASRMLRRMCPKPMVSCEYRAMRGRSGAAGVAVIVGAPLAVVVAVAIGAGQSAVTRLKYMPASTSCLDGG